MDGGLMMKHIQLRPANPDHDFTQLAPLFATQGDEFNSEEALKEEFEKEKERILQKAAFDAQGELQGFYWAFRSRLEVGRYYLNLIVEAEQRHQGVGSFLYQDMLQALIAAQAKRLRIDVRDDFPEGKTFAERRGFVEKLHTIGMELDLEAFDDRPYAALIDRLKGEGFQFTSMEALGNTAEAQRKLYVLNDTAASETPGSEGEHSWTSFEDFQKRVCQADWYKPGGQMFVIDSAKGTWAAMSAITRFEGADYAYNLFTGVDKDYRGRKLAQAVKVLALRYARDVLQVSKVRTHHNTFNAPMLAIDRKLGYKPLPGVYMMEKLLK
jgi:RimJ/RimL family protein N-acetyltransferase/L-amino acid N-acyltransferase YncA